MAKDGDRFEVGSVLWAQLDGFPWWPARVIAPDDIITGSARVTVGKNQLVVFFFNDNSRYCAIDRDKTVPLRKDNFWQTRLNYRGRYCKQITVAMDEALAYTNANPSCTPQPPENAAMEVTPTTAKPLARTGAKTEPRTAKSPVERDNQPKAARRRSGPIDHPPAGNGAPSRQKQQPISDVATQARNAQGDAHHESQNRGNSGTDSATRAHTTAGRRRKKLDGRSRSKDLRPDTAIIIPKTKKRSKPPSDLRPGRSTRDIDVVSPAGATAKDVTGAGANTGAKAASKATAKVKANGTRRSSRVDDKQASTRPLSNKKSPDTGKDGDDGDSSRQPNTKRRRTTDSGVRPSDVSAKPLMGSHRKSSGKTDKASGLDGSKEEPVPVFVSPTGDVCTDKKPDGVEKSDKLAKSEPDIARDRPSKADVEYGSDIEHGRIHSKRNCSKLAPKSTAKNVNNFQNASARARPIARSSTDADAATDAAETGPADVNSPSDDEDALADKQPHEVRKKNTDAVTKDAMNAEARLQCANVDTAMLDKKDEHDNNRESSNGQANRREHMDHDADISARTTDKSGDSACESPTASTKERKQGDRARRKHPPDSSNGTDEEVGSDVPLGDDDSDASHDRLGDDDATENRGDRKSRKRKRGDGQDRYRRSDVDEGPCTSVDFERIADFVPDDALLQPYLDLAKDDLTTLLLRREEELRRCRIALWRTKSTHALEKKKLSSQEDLDIMFENFSRYMNKMCIKIEHMVKKFRGDALRKGSDVLEHIALLSETEKAEYIKLEDKLCNKAHAMRRMYFDTRRVDLAELVNPLRCAVTKLVKYSIRGTVACKDVLGLFVDLYSEIAMEDRWEKSRRRERCGVGGGVPDSDGATATKASQGDAKEDDSKTEDHCADADKVISVDTVTGKAVKQVPAGAAVGEKSDEEMNDKDRLSVEDKATQRRESKCEAVDVVALDFNRGDGAHGKWKSAALERDDAAKEMTAKSKTDDGGTTQSSRSHLQKRRQRHSNGTQNSESGRDSSGGEAAGDGDGGFDRRGETRMGSGDRHETGEIVKDRESADGDERQKRRCGGKDSGSGESGDEEFGRDTSVGKTGALEERQVDEQERGDKRRRGGPKGLLSTARPLDETRREVGAVVSVKREGDNQADDSVGDGPGPGSDDAKGKRHRNGAKLNGVMREGSTLSAAGNTHMNLLMACVKRMSRTRESSVPKTCRKVLCKVLHEMLESEVSERARDKGGSSDAEMLKVAHRKLQHMFQKTGGGAELADRAPDVIYEAWRNCVEAYSGDETSASQEVKRLLQLLLDPDETEKVK